MASSTLVGLLPTISLSRYTWLLMAASSSGPVADPGTAAPTTDPFRPRVGADLPAAYVAGADVRTSAGPEYVVRQMSAPLP